MYTGSGRLGRAAIFAQPLATAYINGSGASNPLDVRCSDPLLAGFGLVRIFQLCAGESQCLKWPYSIDRLSNRCRITIMVTAANAFLSSLILSLKVPIIAWHQLHSSSLLISSHLEFQSCDVSFVASVFVIFSVEGVDDEHSTYEYARITMRMNPKIDRLACIVPVFSQYWPSKCTSRLSVCYISFHFFVGGRQVNYRLRLGWSRAVRNQQ